MASNFNQTLQNKYPHLEISVLKMSEVKKNNDNFRIDSEPFKKSNLMINKNIDYIKLSEISIINPSKTEISEFDLNMEISFISMQNLGNGNINDRETGTIKDYKTGYTYFAENDILVAKITPCMEHGKCSIATNLKNKIGFGSTEFNVFRINDNRFIKEFVFCFLDRENIRKIAADNMIGTSGRQRVPTSFYENLLIPLLPLSFQQEIELLVKTAHNNLEQAKVLYKEAQDLLYQELGLNPDNPLDFIKNNQAINYSIRSLKNSFLKTGRLDSEYYQNKYDEIEKVIKNYQGGYGKTSDYFKQNKKSKSFTLSEYKYIEIGDINTGTATLNYNVIQTNDLPANAKIFLNNGDLLISKVRPNRGAIAIVNFDENNLIGSGAFCVLKETGEIKKEVLMILLRTPLYKEWLLKFNVGTSYPVIKDEDILNLIIPKISIETQTQIAEKIQKSFELRKKSQELLEEAKISVKREIEG